MGRRRRAVQRCYIRQALDSKSCNGKPCQANAKAPPRCILRVSSAQTSNPPSLASPPPLRLPSSLALHSWIPHLGTTLSSSGLEIVSHDRIPVADRYRSIWNQNYLMGYEEYCAGREREHGVEESRRAIGALRDEFRCGVSLDVQFFCVVGRKPL